MLSGTLLLGKRLIYKQRRKFMQTTISNGTIANTCTSLLLFIATSVNQTVSSTYILMPCLLILAKGETKKQVNIYKAIKAVIFAVFITIFSAFLSVFMAFVLLWLNYNGPMANFNNDFHG